VALVAMWLLSGCGGGRGGGTAFVDKEPLPPDTMTTRMGELGRYGGRFVAGATASAKTFNPIMANETSSNDVLNQMFVSLTDIDYRNQEDIPILAKSWEFSNGGRTVTYHLRHGIAFSDGTRSRAMT
jgi:peptide/nickel transport system substrate-binding protein